MGALLGKVEGLGRPTILGIAAALLAGVGLLDRWTGDDALFTLLYLAPVALVAWSLGRRAGLAASLLAAGTSLLAVQRSFPLPIRTWNFAAEVCIFGAVALLVWGIRRHVESESRLARTDALTGVSNRRDLFERGERELARLRRTGSSITALFADVDDFKAVNDRHGHQAGDAVLTTIGRALADAMPPGAVVARLGGDEFVALLVGDARDVVVDLHASVRAALTARGIPATVSIGAVVFAPAPPTVDELLHVADQRLLEAKAAGKDRCMAVAVVPAA